jgi:hypothetical protein
MKRSLLPAILLLAWTSPAIAGPILGPTFALHCKFTTSKASTICTTYSPNAMGIPCTSYNTQGRAGTYNLVYFVVCSLSNGGVEAASFGIDYNGREGQGTGIDARYNTWFPCFDGLSVYSAGEFGDFPAPKGGLRISWISCQNTDVAGQGVHAIVGALQFYAYSADAFRITPNYNATPKPELMAAFCDGGTIDLLKTYPAELIPYLTGEVDVGGSGYVPCGFETWDAVKNRTTWGSLKALFGH